MEENEGRDIIEFPLVTREAQEPNRYVSTADSPESPEPEPLPQPVPEIPGDSSTGIQQFRERLLDVHRMIEHVSRVTG